VHVTLRQLRVFEAVARHRSFTRAAEELFLSQPAVSMQVKQLEENVGLPLLEQIGKKTFLTHAGEEMYQYARSIAQQLTEAQEVMEELRGLNRGRLRVAVATTVNYYATRLLADFCKRLDGVKVSLEVTNREQLLRLLEANDTDIVLMGKPPDGLDLVSEPFMENPLVVIAARGHPFTKRSGIPPEELAKETFLLREHGSGTRIAMERFFADRGITLSGSMEMNSNEGIKQGVEAGLGLGIVSLHTIAPELEAGRLAVLDVQSFPIRRQWYVVHRRGKRLSAVAEAFRRYVLQEGEALATRPAGQRDTAE
jgi:LysR family transcriptional regulator, low CO2-responsive transcriptional regulator